MIPPDLTGLIRRTSRLIPACAGLGLCSSLIACVAASDSPREVGSPVRMAKEPARVLPPTIDPAVKTAGLDGDLAVPAPIPRLEKASDQAPIAAARYEGMAAPGVQIALKGDGSMGPGLRYRWVQTQGPTAILTDPTRATARLTVPEGAGTLGFLLVVSNEAGMDSIPLKIPVEGLARPSVEGEPRADAGDDQIGVVGRQITLNGSRSEPRGKVGFRWIQTGGPAVRLKIEEGHIFSFVPAEPGTYRFALVVASGGVISEPDEVEVTTQSARSPGARAGTVPPMPSPRDPELLGPFVRSTLASIDGGPAAADQIAETFEAVVGRINLYRSYDELFSEMSRRLDAIIPQEPPKRSAWIDRLLGPVTARLVEEMRREGLDLSTAQGRAAPMTDAQRARLGDVFRAIGEGSRAASRPE